MSDTARELLNGLLGLPREERAAIIDEVLRHDQSLLGELEPDPALAAEVERRVAALHAGKMKTAPWDEVRRRIWGQIEDASAD